MKIAFITGYFPSLSETFIQDQITGLLDMGQEIEIYAWPNPRDSKVHPDVEKYDLMERVRYFHMPRNKVHRFCKAVFLLLFNLYKGPIKIFKSLNIFKYHRKASSLKLFYMLVPFLGKEFDIIHCHYGVHGLIGEFLKEVGFPGKLVTSFHGADANSYPRIAGKDVYKNLFRAGDLFTANTNFTKQQIVRLGCNENKIVVLPVGLRIERFKFSPKKLRPGEQVKVLTVGRLVEKKGVEYAIRAIAEIAVKHKNFLYVIAGDGPLKDTLELLVSELKMNDYIRFQGAVTQDEVLKLYQQFHIFLLPSVTAEDGDKEGQALVLQEAQAMGLPVISTLHNGIPEGVEDGRSGFLVPEKDVAALAGAIEYLMLNPDKWGEMGKRGRRFVENKYNINNLNQRLIRIYEHLLDSGTIHNEG